MTAETADTRTLGQKTVIVPQPVHAHLGALQATFRTELGRNVTFGEIIERALDLLDAMREVSHDE